MTFRKEKKYKLTVFELNKIKSLLVKKGMYTLHKTRQIKSAYYDTEELDMFYNSEEGVLPRKKIRIRWYNSDEVATVETKISSIEGRYKETIISDHKPSKKLPKIMQDHLYGLLTPSLFISYKREYYSIDDLRVTFDSCIKYKNLRQFPMIDFSETENVMEIKAPINMSDEFIENIIPYPTSRFSKYSRGLLTSLGGI
tara:strand:- start:2058 stop:2651 length:594 start_codon:yes stop_codon:yes gene_type:complete